MPALRKIIITDSGQVIPKGVNVKTNSQYVREDHVYGLGKIEFKINEIKKKARPESIFEVFFIVKRIKDKRRAYDCKFFTFSPLMSFRKFTQLIQNSWAEPFFIKEYIEKICDICMIRNI